MNEWASWLRRLGVLLLVGGVAGFSVWMPPAAASASAPDAAAPQLAPVHFGSPQAISDAGVFIASARGYFAEQGLNVDTQPFQSGPNTIVPLASGDLDVAGGTFSIALLNAIDRGLKAKGYKGPDPKNPTTTTTPNNPPPNTTPDTPPPSYAY